MVSSEKKSATAAVAGKSARACDNCIRTRARWYCAADDAFLCQSCDSSVHSANPLARRHERVRLKTASLKKILVPTWHRGFTRRSRTPRRQKKMVHKIDSDEQQKPDGVQLFNPLHLVPEFGSEDNSNEEESEEQLLYRVPIFDPFVSHSNGPPTKSRTVVADEDFTRHDMKRLEGFLPTEMDLAEFAADVESLLGKGLDNESFDMEGLGIMNYDAHKEEKEFSGGGRSCMASERVKMEEEDGAAAAEAGRDGGDQGFVDIGRDTFELNFDYDESTIGDGDIGEENKMDIPLDNFDDLKEGNKMFLRLDYERVASAWDNKRCPWTNGERPDLASEECWRPDCMGECGTLHFYGNVGMMSGRSAAMADGGREARVSRYREKRRTRLFSKKIRYEVRKLNAEKRPRMKGRFVKRSNFVAPPFSLGK